MHALLPIPSQLARFIRLPRRRRAERSTAPIRFIRIEIDDRHVPVAAVSGLHRAQPRRLPGAARQRHRGAGGGRGPRRARTRPRSSAAAAATSSASRSTGRCRRACSASSCRSWRSARTRCSSRKACSASPTPPQLIVPDRPDLRLQAVQHPLSRAHPRVQRRLLRRHQQEGHRRPPPLRVLRRRGAVAAPGGRRSQRAWPSSGRSIAPPTTARSCAR